MIRSHTPLRRNAHHSRIVATGELPVNEFLATASHDRRGHRFHELFLRGSALGRPTMPRSGRLWAFVLITIVRAAFLKRCAQCMLPDLPDLPNRFADGSRILDAVPPTSAVRGHPYALRAQQRVRAPCHSFRRFAAAPPQQTGPSATDDTVREPRVHVEVVPAAFARASTLLR